MQRNLFTIAALVALSGALAWTFKPLLRSAAEADAGISALRREVSLLRAQVAPLLGQQPEAPREEAGPGADLAAMRAELLGLREELTGLARRLDRVAPARSTGATSIIEDASDERPSDDRFDAVAAERMEEERFAAIEAALQAEPVDGKWSDHATQVLEWAFTTDELSGTSFWDLECRSSLCRVHVNYDDDDAFDQLQSWLPEEIADEFPRLAMRHIEAGDGSLETVIYLASDGEFRW
jgi:hypothetical protein